MADFAGPVVFMPPASSMSIRRRSSELRQGSVSVRFRDGEELSGVLVAEDAGSVTIQCGGVRFVVLYPFPALRGMSSETREVIADG